MQEYRCFDCPEQIVSYGPPRGPGHSYEYGTIVAEQHNRSVGRGILPRVGRHHLVQT